MSQHLAQELQVLEAQQKCPCVGNANGTVEIKKYQQKVFLKISKNKKNFDNLMLKN